MKIKLFFNNEIVKSLVVFFSWISLALSIIMVLIVLIWADNLDNKKQLHLFTLMLIFGSIFSFQYLYAWREMDIVRKMKIISIYLLTLLCFILEFLVPGK
jgi:hypothetical protein